MSGFSFAFSGDDIEVDNSLENTPAPTTHAAETGSLARRKPSGAFPVTGQPLLPATYHVLEDLLKTLPSKIAYSTLVVKLDDGEEIAIPRRELWDVRVQLMAEDEGSGDADGNGDEAGEKEGLVGLGKDDVKTGVYEGGFKSWESSVDLLKVIAGRRKEGNGEGRRRVLELGCGTALPSLAVLQWYLQTPPTSTTSLALTLADYNPTVLQLVTLPNLLLSWALVTHQQSQTQTQQDPQSTSTTWEPEGELDIDDTLIASFTTTLKAHNINLTFFSGAWSPSFETLVSTHANLQEECESSLIIGAETIYSPVALEAFAETLMRLLGMCEGRRKMALVGAKKVYFGVGGSIEDFVERVVRQGAVVERIREERDGVARVVVEVRKEG